MNSQIIYEKTSMFTGGLCDSLLLVPRGQRLGEGGTFSGQRRIN